jgi:hypothetical protein
MPGCVVVILSSGHCGTRWLASGLRRLSSELEVEHAPLGALYRPRRYFRRYDDPGVILEVAEVRDHVARIERLERGYVETGWPLFAAIPLLAERFRERLRVVHLTRHPVPSALAHAADHAYADSQPGDSYTRFATLGPRDLNVFQPGYADIWDQLSAYEKCLFWWTEIHLFALELPGRLRSVPLLRLKSEAMFSGERRELERLVDFVGLTRSARWPELARRPADRWVTGASDVDGDPLEVHRHPSTVEVARELGYDVSGLTRGELLAHARP